MGKRLLIWCFICICISFLFYPDKVGASHYIQPGHTFNTTGPGVVSYKVKQVLKKQKGTSVNKSKHRTRIWTKMFPFILPERYEDECISFAGYNIFSNNYLSFKCGYDGSWHSHRGPPVLS